MGLTEMLDGLARLFSEPGSTPHGLCLLWRPELVWANVLSDAVIALCYFSIPVCLATLANRRKDVAFGWVFFCFAAFISACGATHLMSIWTIWVPDYTLEVLVKALTAAASVWTATALWTLLPKALSIPSSSETNRVNEDLRERIRERDAALDLLREKNRLLLLAEEMANAGHWRIEMPGYHRTWSEGLFRIFGIDPASGPPTFLGENSGYVPGDRERMAETFDRAMETGEPFALQVDIVRPDGAIRTISIRGICERGEEEGTSSLFGVSIDITDMKQTEDALRLRERQLRTLLDNMPALIGCWDRDLRNVLANRTYSDWYGSDHLAMSGKSIEEVIGPKAFELNRRFIEGALRGEPQRFERCLPRPGGGERHTLAAYVPDVREDGRVEGFFALVTDITEIKLAEARLRESEAFLDRIGRVAKTGGWEVDLRSQTVRWSEHTRRIHEVDDDFEPSFENAVAFYDGEAQDMLRSAYTRLIEHGGTYDLELPLITAKGRRIWVRAVGELETTDGKPARVFGVVRDVTDSKIAEREKAASLMMIEEAKEAAERARAEAEAASVAKSDFLATMSHEIRTPLNAVLGYTDLLLESGKLPAAQTRDAQIVRSAGSALLTIVNDILDFSRIEAGQLALRPAPFDLKALIENAMAMSNGAAIRKGLALRFENRLTLSGEVLGDKDRLQQVVLNLLNNAVKFTHRGSIVLTCESQATGDMIRFAVRDEGIGIAADRIHLLFQRFKQIDGTNARRVGGSGLGLAICKALVTMMGGEIGVESAEGQGSTFWFAVPLPRTERLATVADAVVEPAPSLCAHVLVAEDVMINRELARRVLESGGHTVDVAVDGAEAVTSASRRRYDLILMDVQMPGMDGIAATQRIRALGPPFDRVPIIGMTANVLPAQVDMLRAAGMDGHIGKPFRKTDLLGLVVDVVTRSRSEDAAAAFDVPDLNALELQDL